tara:strand:- start:216 stop:725 length:510 start_codon:yes stop_codon:yes gene_type:complete
MTSKRGLYGAYKGVGETSGDYLSKRYDIETVGYAKEALAANYAIESAERDRMFGAIGRTLELAGKVRSGVERKAEISKDIESLGEAKYMQEHGEEIDWGESVPWKELSPEEKLEWTPTQKKTSFYDIGEPLYEFEGEEFKQSELLNIAGLRTSETLMAKFDLGSKFYKD